MAAFVLMMWAGHASTEIIPFVVIQIFALVVLWFVPQLATWLPHLLYR